MIVEVENEAFHALIDHDRDYAKDHVCSWDRVDVLAYQIFINDFVEDN